MPESSSQELPPKDPALFALAVLVQWWFLLQKPRMQAKAPAALRRLVAVYRAGGGMIWRPGMTQSEVRATSHTALNWLEALAEALERLAE